VKPGQAKQGITITQEHSMPDKFQVTIVRADLEHLEVLAPLFDAYRVFYEQEPDLQGAAAYLQRRLSNLDSVIFLALDGDLGLGFCQLYPSFSSLGMRRIWILYDLYVVPEARRSGIGRALMERAREFGQVSGASRLELSTARDNRGAQALYESLGYARDEEFYYYELAL
jgi:ribosomal protein S18 acetylase RimI-like enzyme